MSHRVVKIIWTAERGDKESHEQATDHDWHLIENIAGSDVAFCSGEVFSFGDTTGEYEIKTVKRGGITCHNCLERLKILKSVKL